MNKSEREGVMAMSNLNLKGIWIPIEVLTDKNLSDNDIGNNIIFK